MPLFVRLALTRESRVPSSSYAGEFVGTIADRHTSRSLGLIDTPIMGIDGVTLDHVWTPEPEAYLGVAPVKMPNLFLYLGPNGAPNSTMVVMIEFQCDYMIKCVQKLQREHLRSMTVRQEAKDDFVRYADDFFAKTVLTDDCASWFKSGGRSDGRITAMWPGSLVHAWHAYAHPRWEDYSYERMPSLGDNGLGWLGSGLAVSQLTGESSTTYLDKVDFPPVDPAHVESAHLRRC